MLLIVASSLLSAATDPESWLYAIVALVVLVLLVADLLALTKPGVRALFYRGSTLPPPLATDAGHDFFDGPSPDTPLTEPALSPDNPRP